MLRLNCRRSGECSAPAEIVQPDHSSCIAPRSPSRYSLRMRTAAHVARVRPHSQLRTVDTDKHKKAAQDARLMKQDLRSSLNSSGEMIHVLTGRSFGIHFRCEETSDKHSKQFYIIYIMRKTRNKLILLIAALAAWRMSDDLELPRHLFKLADFAVNKSPLFA